LKKNSIIFSPQNAQNSFQRNIYEAKKFKNGDRDIQISEQQAFGPERKIGLWFSIF
jgi:hypothetical protein